jgi:hypothetical protein
MKFTIILLFLLFSCERQNAKSILEKSANFHGLSVFQNAEISYNFRGSKFYQKTNAEHFVFCKIQTKENTVIVDSLTNTGFSRHINGEAVALPDSIKDKKARSLNSVVYFASLPFRFLDDAVIAENLGLEEINGETLHKIEIRFKKEGGGDDHDDVFIAWFSSENFRLVYLAYEYHTNGGGMRFRKAKTYHRLAGITLISYENYKAKNKLALRDIAAAFGRKELSYISDIHLENIAIKKVNEGFVK